EGGIGRFLRVDPLGALNPYVYCNNDPLNFVDPWGLEPWQTSFGGYAEDGLPIINVSGVTVGDGDGWAYDYMDSYDDAFIYVIERNQEEGEFLGLPAKRIVYPRRVRGAVGKRGGNRPPGKKPEDEDGGGFEIRAALIAPIDPNMMWSVGLDQCLENALLNNPDPSFSVDFTGRYGFTPAGAGFATQNYITATLEAYANRSWACFQCYIKYGIPNYATEIGDKITYFIGR
ncbi:hypothetical protein KAW18_12215, partial [candidate division WOR-3 bacterium]|nr:hypothetical protein [candidate division WOR-3 bacterium]